MGLELGMGSDGLGARISTPAPSLPYVQSGVVHSPLELVDLELRFACDGQTHSVLVRQVIRWRACHANELRITTRFPGILSLPDDSG